MENSELEKSQKTSTNRFPQDKPNESTRRNIQPPRSEATKSLISSAKNSHTKDSSLEEILSNNRKKNFLGKSLKSGQYRIEIKIGQGGMGEIFKGRDFIRKQDVAIKHIIVSSGIDTEEMLERFRREYYFLSQIHHPHIVKVFDFLIEEGEYFLIMEWIDGVSLKNLLESSPHELSFLDQIAIAHQISEAVNILNMSGILHRDIKPANIMINLKEKKAILLDLGLAKSISNDLQGLTATGTIMGTPEYLSPEQVNGTISQYSDIFSLGITLYQFFLWEKKSPFYSERMIECMDKILSYNPPLIYEKISKNISEIEKKSYLYLSSILAKCLSKDFNCRLNSTSLLSKELEKIYQILSQESSKKTYWKLSVRLDVTELTVIEKLIQEYKKEPIFQNKKNRRRVRNQYQHPKFTLPSWTLKIAMFIIFIISILLAFALGQASQENGVNQEISSHISKEIENNNMLKDKNVFENKNILENKNISETKNTDQDISQSFKQKELSISQVEKQEEIKKLQEEIKKLEKNNAPAGNLKVRLYEIRKEYLVSEYYKLLTRKEKYPQPSETLPLWQLELMVKKIQSDIRFNERDNNFMRLSEAESSHNIQKTTEILEELSEFYQLENSYLDAIRNLHKIPQKSYHHILKIIEFSRKAKLESWLLYYLQQFCLLYPKDALVSKFQAEIAVIENSWNNVSIEPRRKHLRRIFQNLAYLDIAKWEMQQENCYKKFEEINLSTQKYAPDLAPIIKCIYALVMIKENKLDSANAELNSIVPPQEFPNAFLSKFFNQYCWPEIQFTKGVFFYKKGNPISDYYFDVFSNHCLNYPDYERFNPHILSYKDFKGDEEKWKEKICWHLQEFLTTLSIRILVTANQTLSKNQDSKTIQSVLEIYEDSLSLQQNFHLFAMKLGAYLKFSSPQAEYYLNIARINCYHFYEPDFHLGEFYLKNQRFNEAREKFRYCTVFQPAWMPQASEMSRQYLQKLLNDKK